MIVKEEQGFFVVKLDSRIYDKGLLDELIKENDLCFNIEESSGFFVIKAPISMYNSKDMLYEYATAALVEMKNRGLV